MRSWDAKMETGNRVKRALGGGERSETCFSLPEGHPGSGLQGRAWWGEGVEPAGHWVVGQGEESEVEANSKHAGLRPLRACTTLAVRPCGACVLVCAAETAETPARVAGAFCESPDAQAADTCLSRARGKGQGQLLGVWSWCWSRVWETQGWQLASIQLRGKEGSPAEGGGQTAGDWSRKSRVLKGEACAGPDAELHGQLTGTLRLWLMVVGGQELQRA